MEMHLIAYLYHWGADVLWRLSINERKMWVEMLIKQQEAEKESMNGGSSKSSTYQESN